MMYNTAESEYKVVCLLVWTGALPLMDRRLYEWVMVGRGLKMEDRRRGAVISRARKRTEAARANSRLPKEAE